MTTLRQAQGRGGIDPLALDKLPSNILQRQQAADGRAEDGARHWLTAEAGDGRYVKRQGGETAGRPSGPVDYEMYFDTDLGLPVWWTGSDWVDATGASA